MKKSVILIIFTLLWAGLLPAVTVQVGDGENCNTSMSYPAVYGGYFRNSREQYLIEPVELLTAGGGAGEITSVSFSVQTVNGCGSLPNFSIRMGHTAAAALGTNFITGLTEVYSVASYQPVEGLNTHVLDTPFTWNGTESLVVEVSFDFQDSFTFNASSLYTTTPSFKALYYHSDYTPWSGVGVGVQSYNRTNMRFEMAALGPIAPLPATLVSPADANQYVALDATLNWEPGFGDPLSYKVYFGTADPPPLVATFAADVTSYDPALALDTVYYWKIVPSNAQGDAVNCPLWHFTTLPEGGSLIGTGTDYSPRLPVNTFYGYSYSQEIYRASELAGPGQINSLAWYWNGAALGSSSNSWVVYLGHTSKGEFANSTDWEPLAGLTQVFSGDVPLPAVPGWITLTLDTPFGYDGTHNLLVAVDENEPGFDSSMTGFHCTETPEVRSLLFFSDVDDPDPAAPPAATFQRQFLANLVLLASPLPDLAPLAPLPLSPADGQTGMPLEGFELAWRANLNGGGLPEAYGVYLSLDPDPVANPAHYAVTGDPHYDPVAEGAMVFGYSQQWHWSVKAMRTGWPDSAPSAPLSFQIIGSPPEISLDPASFSLSLEHGSSDTRQLEISNGGELPLNYFLSFTDTTPRAPAERSGSRDMFDLQYYFPLTSDDYEIGVGSDGAYIYSCSYANPGEIQKYSLDGTYIGQFTIPGAPGLVDLAYDGLYFWGSTYSGTLCKMDFNSLTLMETVPLPFTDLGVACDVSDNTLWVSCASPGDLIYHVAADGSILGSITAGTNSIIGLGYDNISGYEPCLWAYTQNGPSFNRLHQIDMDTGAVIQFYDVTDAVVPGLNSFSGGMEVVSGLVPGKASLLCCAQDYAAYALELSGLGTWSWPDPAIGEVAGGSTGFTQITFDSSELDPGTYTGSYTVTHNDPAAPPLEIPVQLTVTGTWPAELALLPSAHDYGEVELLNPSVFEFRITNTGGSVPAPLTIPEGGVSLALQSEQNFSLQAPGLPVTLYHGQSYIFTVTFTPQTPGEKTGSLSVTDGLGRSVISAPLNGTGIAEPIGHIVNLQAAVQNNDVVLTWILGPETPAEPGWLYYDSGWNAEGIGPGMEGTIEVAAKFPTAVLAPYAGQQLSQISFLPRSALTTYTLKVYSGDDSSLAPSSLLISQPVVPSAYAWNEVSLENPLWITGTQALWVGYEAAVPADSDDYYPVGVDDGPAVAGYGDLMFFEGNWFSLYNGYGLNFNWNIHAWIGPPPPISPPPGPPVIQALRYSPDPGLLHRFRPALSGNPSPPDRVVRGFNVYRDGSLLNPELIPTPTYTDLDVPNGTHVYGVEAVYYSSSSFSADPVTVTIDYYPPLSLPYFTSFESGSLEAEHWDWWVTNWQLAWGAGYPDPCLMFAWTPVLLGYGEPVTSHTLDGAGFDEITLSFDMCLDNYDLNAENWLAAEVWNGTEWFTLECWSSSMNAGAGLPWANYSYDLSPWAAGREFRVRFRAYGQDSYSINFWGIDNLYVHGIPAYLPAPAATAAYDPVTQMVLLDWEPVSGAEWYGIYGGSDPLAPLPLLGWIPAPETSYPLTLASKAFYRVSAGAGPPPERSQRAGQ